VAQALDTHYITTADMDLLNAWRRSPADWKRGI